MSPRMTEWTPYSPCPCGCGEIHQKLSAPIKKGPHTGEQHVVGCKCRHHLGKRAQKNGRRAQATMHRNLGGTGFTPSNEESARPYPLEIMVMPESKTGGQVPANWDRFVDTDWFQRALRQSEMAVPVGSGVKPAVVVRGRWLIVDTEVKR